MSQERLNEIRSKLDHTRLHFANLTTPTANANALRAANGASVVAREGA